MKFDSLLRGGLGRESAEEERKCLGTGQPVPSVPCKGDTQLYSKQVCRVARE